MLEIWDKSELPPTGSWKKAYKLESMRKINSLSRRHLYALVMQVPGVIGPAYDLQIHIVKAMWLVQEMTEITFGRTIRSLKNNVATTGVITKQRSTQGASPVTNGEISSRQGRNDRTADHDERQSSHVGCKEVRRQGLLIRLKEEEIQRVVPEMYVRAEWRQ
jgi:hypothetical protein